MIKEQNVFVKRYGTGCNILKLMQLLQSYKKKDKMDILFIDYKSAYNTVIREKLYDSLVEKRVLTVNETLFLKSLLSRSYFEH